MLSDMKTKSQKLMWFLPASPCLSWVTGPWNRHVVRKLKPPGEAAYDCSNWWVQLTDPWPLTWVNLPMILGLSCWLSGKESTCQYRRHRFDPWSGKIPHAAGHLSLCTTTTESMHPRAHALQQEKPPQWEAQALRLESSPHSPQLQKNPGSNKDSAQTKIKKWNYLKKNDFHLQHCICLYHCLVELRENIVAELCPNSRFVSHINAVLSQKLERWFVTQK